MPNLRRQIRFTYANVMATAAVVVALCGAGIPQATAAAIVSYARNAGAVDGLSATNVPRPGALLALDEDRKFPASVLDLSHVYSKGAADRRFVGVGDPVDADTLDGLSASKYPKAGKLLPLNANGKFSASVLDLPDVDAYSRADADTRFAAKGSIVDGYSKADADARFAAKGAVVASTDADTLDGLDSTAFRKAVDAVDAATLNGQVASSFLGANAKATDADKLDGFTSADFRKAADAVDATTLNGQVASSFLAANAKAVDADKLDGFDSAAFRKTTDAVDATTLNGQASTSFLSASAKAVDADKLDGFDSAAFRKATDAVDATTLNGQASTSFLGATAKAADADKLDGFDSAAFRKTADAVDATTFGGFGLATFLRSTDTAGDSDKLDGLDSTAFRKVADPVDAATLGGQAPSNFLGASGKAADANLLDGVDSAQFVRTNTGLNTVLGAEVGNFAGVERYRPQSSQSRRGGTSTSGGGVECYIGELRLFPYNFEPGGWVYAHGQTLPIAQNSALFSLLGTTYGGDGQTTFQLPDTYGLGPEGMAYSICLNGIYPSRN